jgi:hypothetical protein
MADLHLHEQGERRNLAISEFTPEESPEAFRLKSSQRACEQTAYREPEQRSQWYSGMAGPYAPMAAEMDGWELTSGRLPGAEGKGMKMRSAFEIGNWIKRTKACRSACESDARAVAI